MDIPPVSFFLDIVRKWAAASFPGSKPKAVRIILENGAVVELPLLETGPTAEVASPFTPQQLKIRAALKGRYLKTAALVKATGIDSGNLFKKGHLLELKEWGIVLHQEPEGFYDAEFPPGNGEAETA